MKQETNEYFNDQFENLDDIHYTGKIPFIKNIPRGEQRAMKKRKSQSRTKSSREHILAELMEQADDVSTFEFTYKAARHEHVWLIDALGRFYEQQWLDDVLSFFTL